MAAGKAATQASTYDVAAASRAVDGNTNGSYNANSVTHTLGGAREWWQVDLGQVYALEQVKVWNRTDCCSDRLSDFYVFVSDTPFTSTDLTATLSQSGVTAYHTPGQGGTPTAITSNRTGRYVRVQLAAGSGVVSLAEVEVMGTAGGGPGAGASGGIRWLVSDHLGTPRMTADLTGSLAGITRHDYLPFGEEIGAGTGGRTTGQGYSQLDGVRQGFTGYEKDGETGLNFAQARYYSPTMGRFTSPDQPLVDQWQSNPQSWNLYAYVRNNPLNLVDPIGMAAECPRGWEGCIERDGKFYWPRPETGEEIEIDNSVIVVDSADSGVPRDGGGPNLTVGEAIQQQQERRTGFIVNNIAAGIGYGIGKIFKGIGSLFRGSSANSAQFANGVTRAALQAAANDPGPTVQVVTRLTQAPAPGRALSVAVGDGAEALAGAARSGGQTYTARIPKALIETMKSARLVEERITQMGGTRAVELRFRPEAAEFITRFFQ